MNKILVDFCKALISVLISWIILIIMTKIFINTIAEIILVFAILYISHIVDLILFNGE